MAGANASGDAAGGSSAHKLDDGSRVAVVGAGPAGSLCAYFLLDLAQRVGRTFHVDLYETKDFSSDGPGGCNHCGGVVSESLVQNLASEGINIPLGVMQRGITSYVMHTETGVERIKAARHEKRIAVVYRGGGPRGNHQQDLHSFDGFLQDLAVSKGAHLVRETVQKVDIEAGRPVVTSGAGREAPYDLLVGAVGVNARSEKLFEGMGFGYRAPATIRTCVCEFPLPRDDVQKYLGDAMHVFLLNIPRLVFAALVPKGNYVTLCLLGDRLDKELVDAFLSAPEVKKRFPFDWSLVGGACRCFPKASISEARPAFAERVVLIGDCGVTRLYKDGIRAAYITAKAAASAAVLHGVGAADFRRHYWPVCRRIRLDNSFGRMVFKLTAMIKSMSMVKRAILGMVHREQQREGNPPRMSSVLWDTFTGSARYVSIVLRGMSPLFLLALTRELLRAMVTKGGGREAAEDPDPSGHALGRVYADGEIIVSEGDTGDCMYVVQAGKVEIVQNRRGRDVVLAELGETDVFGEMALFDREVRSATVRAAGEATVLTVDRANLFSRIHEDPSVALRTLEKLSLRVRELNGQVSRMRAADRRDWNTRPETDDDGRGQRGAPS